MRTVPIFAFRPRTSPVRISFIVAALLVGAGCRTASIGDPTKIGFSEDLTREDVEKKLGIPVYIHHEDLMEILQPWA